MRKLKLRNAKIETLTDDRISFIGELKSSIYRLSYTIDKITNEQLKQLKENKVYNIWEIDNNFKFIEQ